MLLKDDKHITIEFHTEINCIILNGKDLHLVSFERKCKLMLLIL